MQPFSSAILFPEVLYELTRTVLAPNYCIREALQHNPPQLPDCTLTCHQSDIVRKLARILWRTGKLSPSSIVCIHRSVAAVRILRRRRIPHRLAIAPSSLTEQFFTAHAWVELPDGLTIGAAIRRPVEFRAVPMSGAQGQS